MNQPFTPSSKWGGLIPSHASRRISANARTSHGSHRSQNPLFVEDSSGVDVVSVSGQAFTFDVASISAELYTSACAFSSRPVFSMFSILSGSQSYNTDLEGIVNV